MLVGSRLFVLCTAVLCAACTDREQPAARNVVLVTIDTLRADHVGAYGGPVPTPALDALAADGVLLENACTPTPSTGPALASLLTGLYPWNHGVLLNAVPIDDPDLPNLAEHMRAAGFATAGFVSSHNVAGRYAFDRGFDHFRFEGSRSFDGTARFWNLGEETTDAVLEWLDSHHRRRFFVWVHYFDPHSPYTPPKRFRRPDDEPIDLSGKTLPPMLRTVEQLRAAIRGYRGNVVYTDSEFGRLIAKLRELGRLDETAVIVTSDHGEGLGDHGVLDHGQNLYDELVRVPLLIRAPGIRGGRRLNGPAQLEDLMPTTLALAGVPVPEGLDGIDLTPWLRAEVEASPRSLVMGRRASFANTPALYYTRRWPEKWIGPLDRSGFAFRLDLDPREAERSPAPPPEVIEKSAAAAARRIRERVLNDESREALEALGYLE